MQEGSGGASLSWPCPTPCVPSMGAMLQCLPIEMNYNFNSEMDRKTCFVFYEIMLLLIIVIVVVVVIVVQWCGKLLIIYLREFALCYERHPESMRG